MGLGHRIAAALLVACIALPAWAGGVRVVDGDTLELKGEKIRLLYIDAPEHGQRCTTREGRGYDCGAAATKALRKLVSRGRVVCRGSERDQYGRLLAHCAVDGQDIGAALVAGGYAVAYREYGDEYLDQELDAAKAGRGLWAGGFELPSEYRRAMRAATAQKAPDPGCRIKGNISRSGARIYHRPGDGSYQATRIDTGKGERWFCDEAEARRAGWRPPRGG